MASRRSVCVLALLGASAVAQTWPSEVPYWPRYPSRLTTVLSGSWSFGFSAEGDPTTIAYSDIATPNTTTVPGAFDVAPPGVLGPRGNAFFRSVHNCTPGVSALLKFGAVNFYARVFVDGADIGHHTAGGYTPFQMVAPACAAMGSREVVIVCNNQPLNATSPTFTGGDFYFYSGIIRPVIVTELPSKVPYWLDRVEPISTDYVNGLIDVRIVLGGDTSSISSTHLQFGFNGAPVGPPADYVLVNKTAVIANVPVPAFRLWSLGKGNLFTLQIVDAISGDSIQVRSGLRVLGIDKPTARVTINGEVVKLLGFNRHTIWPDTGAAVSPAQEAADVALLQGLNANYVRGAHYPQSQSFLDLCDEAGIAIWEETLGPGTSTKNMNDPWFMANHLEAVASMVETSLSHPSVIIHGFFNEGPSDKADACVGYAASSAAIKARVGTPPARFVTWANDHTQADVCMAFEDVISFNSYPGWYDHEGNVTYPPVFWGAQAAWVSANHPQVPFFVSETGGGGVWEWLNDTAPYPGPQWSQAYQKNLVSVDADFLANDPRVSGLTLWQFSDIKANDGDTAGCGQCDYLPHPDNLTVPWDCAYVDVKKCGRPKGENNKGSVDLWRRRKEEYAALAAIFGAATAD